MYHTLTYWNVRQWWIDPPSNCVLVEGGKCEWMSSIFLTHTENVITYFCLIWAFKKMTFSSINL